ncbi:gamma-glutamylcyclotransferase family protein [Solidesulfovibrio sp.]|uniref:gamma-glutamylcyclotransferase family protein n=1 Tax=Solidesulfovibrio sp. TaxID=2910990 RepID=UPI002635265A|nr:gamma-glutamylcyclotransferase family protein [Solidesulfovibrio sp.]
MKKTEMYWDIFAYGTLRQGFRNHHYVAGCPCLGRAETVEAYAMYVAGDIPYLVADEPHSRVVGEVYRVDATRLRELDALEEHPREYCRAVAPVVMADGATAQAWIYFARRPFEGVLHTGDFAAWTPSRF